MARRQIVDQNPELVIVGGDLTRDGFYHDFELEAVRVNLHGMGIPCYVIPGNMDLRNKHTAVRGPQPNNNDVE